MIGHIFRDRPVVYWVLPGAGAASIGMSCDRGATLWDSGLNSYVRGGMSYVSPGMSDDSGPVRDDSSAGWLDSGTRS